MEENDGLTTKKTSLRTILILASIVGFVLLLINASWIGYRNYADDVFTIRGALLWLDDFPYIGTTHWELRHPFVLGVAAFVGALGLSELSVMMTNILVLVALILIIWITTYRRQDTKTAVLSAVFIAATPIFLFGASTLFPGLVELFFLTVSVTLYSRALNQSTTNAIPHWTLVAAGIAGGLAFVTRETAAALGIFYFILFLSGFRLRRVAYLWIAAGFMLPVLADIGYVTAKTGDPAYRYKIDLAQHHPWDEKASFDYLNPLPSAGDILAQPSKGVSRVLDFAASKGEHVGPVDAGAMWNPYIALFTNHEYAATFGMALVVLAAFIFGGFKASYVSLEVRLFLLLGLIWFFVATYVLSVRPHPRYYLPTTLGIVLLNATYAANLFTHRRYVFGTILIVLVLGASALAIDVHSERLHEERVLVDVAKQFQEPVYAVPKVVAAAKFFSQTQGIDRLIKGAPPPAGALFLFSEKSLETVQTDARKAYFDENWQEIERWEPRDRIAGSLLARLGLLELMPDHLATKLYRPTPTIVLYRTAIHP